MKIKLASVVAPLGIASVIAFSPASTAAGYLTDSSGQVVTSGYGLCWDGVWENPDMLEQCGDMMPKADDGDADMDGIPDSMDKCPGTAKGIIVDSEGCPADSDGDGVIDSNDQCPDTRAGAKVNSAGCEIIGNVTINLVNDEFDFDSAALKPAMKSALDSVISKIKGTPGDESLNIIGHTDSTGPADYNQGLSERRAQSVAGYLQSNGISGSNMSISGRGESQPVADNGTRDGRQKNRRVEIQSK